MTSRVFVITVGPITGTRTARRIIVSSGAIITRPCALRQERGNASRKNTNSTYIMSSCGVRRETHAFFVLGGPPRATHDHRRQVMGKKEKKRRSQYYHRLRSVVCIRYNNNNNNDNRRSSHYNSAPYKTVYRRRVCRSAVAKTFRLLPPPHNRHFGVSGYDVFVCPDTRIRPTRTFPRRTR